jgi:hypothetical protein
MPSLSSRRRLGLLTAACLFLLGPLLLSTEASSAQYGLVPGQDFLREQVREPLFAFVLTMTEKDSLGTWTADDLHEFARDWDHPTVFPLLQHVESLTREDLPAVRQQRLAGAVCSRRWVIRLEPQQLEVPMPFSVLGYRPGKLSFQGPLCLQEWRLGRRRLNLVSPEGSRALEVEGLTIYRLTEGWLILDVHDWLDHLLGNLLEDASMEGFIVGNAAGELVGIGNSAGRRGRRLFGELDFRTSKVQTAGRPLTQALSRFGRTWTRPSGFDHRAVWKAYRR